MATNIRKRCYFGCENHGPLHSFPKPKFPHMKKFAMWKKILGEDVIERGDVYIYNQIRLCNKHFEQYFISNSNRLTANAIPTLCLNDSAQTQLCPNTEEMIAPETSTEPVAMTSKTSDLEEIILSNQQQKPELSGRHIRKSSSVKSIEKLKNKIKKLSIKCKNEKEKLRLVKKMSKNRTFLKTVDKLPKHIKLFTLMQMKYKKKPKGRRYSLEEKIMALTIYKQSQKSYRLLRKMFVLPSKRSLQNLLSFFNIQPGINPKIMENLKQHVRNLPAEKKLCTLLFDEVALSVSLQFDLKKHEIIGFEDNGNQKSKLIADHALVFMIKGIKSKTKQPICFSFCQGTTKKHELKSILTKVIKDVSDTGIKIVVTVCDQATTNAATIKSLKEETRIKYVKENKEYQSTAYEIENLKNFHIFDPPHLLKGVRNNFMKKNLKFHQNGKEKVAKHLKMLLEVDIGEDEIRLVNKLTEKHVNVEKINKMKVKFAAQVFSQRVSSAMRFLASKFHLMFVYPTSLCRVNTLAREYGTGHVQKIFQSK